MMNINVNFVLLYITWDKYLPAYVWILFMEKEKELKVMAECDWNVDVQH